jgi:D-3-phosphoglycerate dehydrogenase / 2-oxoglutarate reductase
MVSDIVNISVPLTKSTENMIAEPEFQYFKKNAILRQPGNPPL